MFRPATRIESLNLTASFEFCSCKGQAAFQKCDDTGKELTTSRLQIAQVTGGEQDASSQRYIIYGGRKQFQCILPTIGAGCLDSAEKVDNRGSENNSHEEVNAYIDKI